MRRILIGRRAVVGLLNAFRRHPYIVDELDPKEYEAIVEFFERSLQFYSDLRSQYAGFVERLRRRRM